MCSETGLIGAYLEGVADGRFFLNALKKASRKKPVILWKVGLTPEGGRAAFSHTGALAGAREMWKGVVRQEFPFLNLPNARCEHIPRSDDIIFGVRKGRNISKARNEVSPRRRAQEEDTDRENVQIG